MIRYGRRDWAMAAALSALAGFVDAIGFIKLGGLFVSFMSGNSTQLAVSLASASSASWIAGPLIASFVVGVMLGTAIATASGRWHRFGVLALVAILLGGAAAADADSHARWTVMLLSLAMGAENAVFQRDGEVSVGVTYMTGTLVKLGQRATAALLGGPRLDWLPYLLLWAGLVAGALAGALLYPRLGSASLASAAAIAGLLAIVAAFGRDR